MLRQEGISSLYDSVSQRRKHDRGVVVRNVLMSINVIISIILMVVTVRKTKCGKGGCCLVLIEFGMSDAASQLLLTTDARRVGRRAF